MTSTDWLDGEQAEKSLIDDHFLIHSFFLVALFIATETTVKINKLPTGSPRGTHVTRKNSSHARRTQEMSDDTRPFVFYGNVQKKHERVLLRFSN